MLTRRTRIRGHEWMAYDTVGLGISVGKPAHEGDDFEAAVDMIASLGKPCIIRLSDTLQRHNLMADGMDVREAWRHSREMGDAWLDRNDSLLNILPFKPIIVRWDDVMSDSDYENTLESYNRLYPADPLFSAALDEDVSRFLVRRTYSSYEEETIHSQCSRAFLMEELAGQTILGRRYSYAGFYPGKPAKVLEVVRNNKIALAPKGLENTAFIRFTLETRHHPANESSPLHRKAL